MRAVAFSLQLVDASLSCDMTQSCSLRNVEVCLLKCIECKKKKTKPIALCKSKENFKENCCPFRLPMCLCGVWWRSVERGWGDMFQDSGGW